MRLRTLLALMFSLLLASTAALIGWVGYSKSRTEIKRFTTQEFAQANTFTTHHVVDFLDAPANRLLNEFAVRAQRGMLKFNDDQALGADFGERLRVNPTLTWISYSDAATGHFVGVWRTESGDVVLDVSSTAADQKSKNGLNSQREVIIKPDGTMIPYPYSATGPYDPRTFSWFKNAMASNTTVWSQPYDFNEGEEGITASRAWRPTDTASGAGVFTVDFLLKDLEEVLDGTAANFTDQELFCAVLEPEGPVICHSTSPDAQALVKALAEFVAANPQFKDNSLTNSHLVSLKIGAIEYLAALHHVNAPSGLQCIVASVAPRALIFRGLDKAAREMIEIAVGALVVAVALGAFMAYRVSAPLHRLGDDLTSVGQFQLGGGASPRSMVLEVNQLHEAADRMKKGLRSFLKFVPGDLVRQVLASGREAVLGGEMRRLTVFFSDIENFTAYSESMPPDKLVHELADYLEIVSGQLRRHAGEIDKFIGDGVLAFFNAPVNVANHESCSCRAALAVQRELETRQKGPTFRTRIGLHTGDVLVGNMGTAERLAYTVLGDVVNVTSRLENLNKVYGTRVLASGEVRERTGAEFEWRHMDRAAVAGRKGGLEIYELLGAEGKVDRERLRRRDLYEKALEFYFAQKFTEAGALFAEVAGDGSADQAAAVMVARCDAFTSKPLPADWDGVFVHDAK